MQKARLYDVRKIAHHRHSKKSVGADKKCRNGDDKLLNASGIEEIEVRLAEWRVTNALLLTRKLVLGIP